ncbi:MAG: hypothetical protein LBK01_06910 [Burkholderiaceae bacterium]|jgi:hypothetical protein|nr:hypothetical protein [Burkholderiaceae bacterium]
METFKQRSIEVSINIAEGQDGADEGTTITLTNFRIVAHIHYSGGSMQGKALVRIFGLSESELNRLTGTAQAANEVRQNRITIKAGDHGEVLPLIYDGTIRNGSVNFNEMPNAPLALQCQGNPWEAVAPFPPHDGRGAEKAQDIIAYLAKANGYGFENHGVDVSLDNMNLKGTWLAQLQAVVEAAQIDISIERGVIAIWNRGGARVYAPVEVSVETGMVGYPVFGARGIIVTTLLNPEFMLGRLVHVKSEYQPACGYWTILSHEMFIADETPDGQWFSVIECGRFEKRNAGSGK